MNSQYGPLTPVFTAAWPNGLKIVSGEELKQQKKIISSLLDDSNSILQYIATNAYIYRQKRIEFYDKVNSSVDQGPITDLSFRVDEEAVQILIDGLNCVSQALFETYVDDYALDKYLFFLDFKALFLGGDSQAELRQIFQSNTHREAFGTIISCSEKLNRILPVQSQYAFDSSADMTRWVLFVHRVAVCLGAMFDLVTYQMDLVLDDSSGVPKTDRPFDSELIQILQTNASDEDDEDFSLSKEGDSSNDPKENMDLQSKTQKGDKAQEEQFASNDEDLGIKMKKMGQKAKLLINTLTGKQGFFKKYMGRIDGLYEHYGDATIRENAMIGDPTSILLGPAKKYIETLSVNTGKIYKELMEVAKAMGGATSPDAQLEAANRFMKVDMKTAKNLKDEFYRAFFTRVASAILTDVKVYGFNVEGIVENRKVPPPNHVIVSLFVSNAHEEPHELAINEIFDGPESFKIMDNIQKVPIYDIVNSSTSIIKGAGSSQEFKQISDFKQKSLANLKNHKSGSSFDDEHIEKKKERQVEAVWKGLQHSLQKFLTMKNYLIQCCDSYMNMVDRVDTLARQAMAAMLEAEKGSRDANYKTGFGATSSGKIASMAQNQDYTKKQDATKAERVLGAAGGMIQNKSFSKAARNEGVAKAVNAPLERKKEGASAPSAEDRKRWNEGLDKAKKRLKLNEKTASPFG